MMMRGYECETMIGRLYVIFFWTISYKVDFGVFSCLEFF